MDDEFATLAPPSAATLPRHAAAAAAPADAGGAPQTPSGGAVTRLLLESLALLAFAVVPLQAWAALLLFLVFAIMWERSGSR